MTIDLPQLLTVNEVAASLSVSKMTVHRLIDAGELPAYRIGRSVRVRHDALMAYLAGNEEGAP